MKLIFIFGFSFFVLINTPLSAQMIKSLEVSKEQVDNDYTTFVLKVSFDKNYDKETREELVKKELLNAHSINTEDIQRFESFNDKKFLVYRYRVLVKNNE